MKIKYTCKGYRPIVMDTECEDINPARVFAERMARREYGRRGQVGALRLDSYTQDGTCSAYEAFIGAPASDGNGIVGHNVWLCVTCEKV